jgi:hypothetical protein
MIISAWLVSKGIPIRAALIVAACVYCLNLPASLFLVRETLAPAEHKPFLMKDFARLQHMFLVLAKVGKCSRNTVKPTDRSACPGFPGNSYYM